MQEVTDRMWDSLSYAQLELYQDESSGDDFIYWAYPVTAHPWERTTRLHTRCSRPVQRVASFPVLLIVFLSQPILFLSFYPSVVGLMYTHYCVFLLFNYSTAFS